MINASNEGICGWVLKKQQHNLGLPTFKLPASTKTLLRLTPLILFLMVSVYDYYDIGQSSVQVHHLISTVWLWSKDEY